MFAALSALLWFAMVWPLFHAISAKFHQPALIALVASFAVGVGFTAIARGFGRAVLALPRWAFLLLTSTASAVITQAAIRLIARGHTLSPDGAVYWFQGRALSHGSFGTPLEFPRQFWSMRFLFEGPDGQLHGVFPPGWPLFVAPFVRAGAPFASGLVVSALLSVAGYLLARRLSETERFSSDPEENERTRELVARIAAILPLPSFSRAIETTDLLSHAFVAALGTFAITLSLGFDVQAPRRPLLLRSLAIGALIGWAFSARLLDGLLFAIGCAAVLLARSFSALRSGARRAFVTSVLAILLGAAPFVGLIAAHQRAATGSWTTPTQREYFVRSDFPATCHRLGFGRDVGCEVEHGDDRAMMGPEGYTPRYAWAVVRSRAIVLGDDLLGPPHLLALALALAAVGTSRRAAFSAVFCGGFTLAYGLFYYGNAPLFGARHLFPLAPFVYYLTARACALPARRWPGVAPAALFALSIFVATIVGQSVRWRAILRAEGELAQRHPWVRPTIDRAADPQGIIVVPDNFHAITGYDPWLDRGRRVVVTGDDAGLRELRRARPTWPVYVATRERTLVVLSLPPVQDEVMVELEAMWPSLQWPVGLKAWQFEASRFGEPVIVGGGRMLAVAHAQPGSRLRVDFELAVDGRYVPGIVAFAAPTHGNYRVTLDGAPLLLLDGYNESRVRRLYDGQPVTLRRGRHSLSFECVRRDPRSSGDDALLDQFIARPAR